jgi:hypothetical protein
MVSRITTHDIENRRTLKEVVTHLEKMAAMERTRWVEFLSYILALVYHARGQEEQPELRDVVDRSVQTDLHRKEYTKMGRTIAEMYMDQGRTEGLIVGEQKGALNSARTILLRQLRMRFKKVPRRVEARIVATKNMQELETWLDNFANATTLADVGIPPT